MEVYKDENGNEIGNNGGIDWLVPITDDHFYLIRGLTGNYVKPVRIKMFTFKPMRKFYRDFIAKIKSDKAAASINYHYAREIQYNKL